MGRSFLPAEKVRQARFKIESGYFSKHAQGDGIYRGKLRPFCVPRDLSPENLYPPIRERADAFFSDHKIKWHDAIAHKPSNHLCDSQVACVNFLFPLADKPEAVRLLLRPVVPQIEKVLPIEDDSFVTFEWIGLTNYLGEKVPRGATDQGAPIARAPTPPSSSRIRTARSKSCSSSGSIQRPTRPPH